MQKHQRYQMIKDVERRIRASIQYSRWVDKNRATSCIRCGALDGLEVHHMVELYHIILGLWKFYGDWDVVLSHALLTHDTNKYEGVTICSKCHELLHPGRTIAYSKDDVRVTDWIVMPRKLDFKFSIGTKNVDPDSIGLLGLQTLCGIGWHILNGYMSSNEIVFNWRRFAEVVGKVPSTSFNNGFEIALESLVKNNVIEAFSRNDKEVKIRLTPNFKSMLQINPWFISIEDIKTSRMVVLLLRILLSFHGNKQNYLIMKDKLASYLQMETTTPAFINKSVLSAVDEIPWTEVKDEGDKFKFSLKKRGAIPVYSLRSCLSHALTLA
jgi:hypothetical protein